MSQILFEVATLARAWKFFPAFSIGRSCLGLEIAVGTKVVGFGNMPRIWHALTSIGMALVAWATMMRLTWSTVDCKSLVSSDSESVMHLLSQISRLRLRSFAQASDTHFLSYY